MALRVLVLGASGNFGERICKALARGEGMEVVCAGRRLAPAVAVAKEAGGSCVGAAMDLEAADFAERVSKLGIGLVIHAAGPFQGQGWNVAAACAKARAHYVDLADGRRFVCDFSKAMDGAFKEAGVAGISGASTVPALSAAAAASLARGWSRVDSIRTCVAPGQRAPRGVATMEAVLGYCGEPVRVMEGGVWFDKPGWGAPKRVEFARMVPRRAALCDVPDLEIFPEMFGAQSVDFGAALEVGFTQWSFAAIAKARGWGLIPNPRFLGRALHALGPLADPFGSGLGGMFVRAEGLDGQGRPARRSWHVAAPDGHGPEIPCMPAILLARRLAAGEAFAPGARAAAGVLALEEFDAEFDKWGMLRDLKEEAIDG